MFALIKLPFKLLSLPLMIVCAGLSLLAKLCSNLSGYILSPLILFVCLYGNFAAMESGAALGHHRTALYFSVVRVCPD